MTNAFTQDTPAAQARLTVNAGRLLRRLFKESPWDLKARIVGIYAVIAVLHVGAWVGALFVFHGQPVLLGVALMAYGLGLRHAVDADHIAAIDNVTRKLMQGMRRPVSVGFFFALGHSAVVIIVVATVVSASNVLNHLESFRNVARTIGVSVSTLFLLAIAAMNIVILRSTFRIYRRARSGEPQSVNDRDPVGHPGILTRICQPLFGLVTRSWHMFPLGFLFGLGLDTATEVAMISMSVAQAAQGISVWTILLLPLLFAAGMSLIDTTDGILMLRAYEWAFLSPVRKLYYNMMFILMSVVVALLIGGIEALGLLAENLDLRGPVWRTILILNDNLDKLGVVIVGLFLSAWLIFHRLSARNASR